MKKDLKRQTKRNIPLDRFYFNEAGDPSFVNRYLYEKTYSPLSEESDDKSRDFDHICETFSNVWESSALFVWFMCQEEDREEPIYWTC